MKKRYKVIVVIFVSIFIILIAILSLKKNKDYLNSVESASKKYLISYESGYTTTYESSGKVECDKYYSGIGTKVYQYNEVTEGYPMYVFNNCAVEIDYYLKKTNDDVNACNTYKNYIVNKVSTDKDSVEEFNELCIDSGVLNESNRLTVSKKVTTCNNFALKTSGNYDVSKFEYEPSYVCISDSNPLKGQTGILSPSAVNVTGSRPIYLVQGCSWSLEGIAKDEANACVTDEYKKNVCLAEKNFIEEDLGNRHVYISGFNSSCVDTGILNESSRLTYTNDEICKTFSTKTSGNYDVSKFEYEPSYVCISDSNPLKGQTGILSPSAVNVTGSRPIYLVQGCSWSLEGITKDEDNICITNDFKKKVCLYEKSFIEEKLDERQGYIYNYNLRCVDTGILSEDNRLEKNSYIDIIFRASNAYGLECNEHSTAQYRAFTSSNNECTYRFNKKLSGTSISISTLPKTDSLYQLVTGYGFDGWRRSSEKSCNKGSSLTLTLPLDVTEISFEACFDGIEKSSTGYALYNKCDGSYITPDITGKIDVSNTAILTSSIRTIQEYNYNDIDSSNIESSVYVEHGNGFNLNQFCNISCTETVNYRYPTIFETVKSGTYFEVLSYPEVKTSLTCQENFNYDNWKQIYLDQIEVEKKVYVEKVNSTKINAWSSVSRSATTSCGYTCPTYTCGSEGKSCCKDYYDIITLTDNSMLKYNSGNVETTSFSYSACEQDTSDHLTAAKTKARSDFYLNSSIDYSAKYNTEQGKRKAIETANTSCVKALKKNSVSTDNYYKTTPNLYFYYESIVDSNNSSKLNGDSVEYYKDTLKATSSYMKDTDVHDWEKDTFYTETVPISFGYDGNNFTFNSIKTNSSFLRTVTRNYVYNKSDSHPKYYAKNQTGDITTSASKSIELGYVYPIPLTISGTRNVYFALDFNTNLTYGATTILSTEGTSVTDKNVYQCSYDISNDVIIDDNSTITADDFKKNFYIRSISTQDVDPNDRFNKGLLGANWSTAKGQTLITEIEKKASTKDTYNPENLEYSFTLNALTIEAIKDYNSTTEYDDFKLDCNNFGGECKSKFLEALNDSKIDGKNLTNVNPYMKRLTDPTWKYYIGDKWYILETLTDYKKYSSDCSSYIHIGDKAYYECLYKNVNEGVLP